MNEKQRLVYDLALAYTPYSAQDSEHALLSHDFVELFRHSLKSIAIELDVEYDELVQLLRL